MTDWGRVDQIIESVDAMVTEGGSEGRLLTEAITITSTNPTTTEKNLHKHIDKMWKDLRSTFKLLDKVGESVAEQETSLSTTKAVLVAAGLEIRRQVKNVQKDLAKARKDMQKQAKEQKKQQEELLKAIEDFKKMVDLYLNPPNAMGPISRQTLQAFKGLEKS